MDKRQQRVRTLPVVKSEEPTETLSRDTLEVHLGPHVHALPVHALHVLDGAHAGQIFVVETVSAVVGRGDNCQFSLCDAAVSRAHAVFTRCGLALQVMDLHSRNGTSVNGRPLAEATTLVQGDTILLGGIRLRYGIEAEEQVTRLRTLHQAAVIDHLTGLYNRRFFEERLAAEVAYAVRHRAPLSLLMFDVDRFKLVNDTYGHVAGDVALQAVAVALQRGVRTEDLVARYGGEEFVVVARGSGIEGATALAERLCARVAQLVLEYEGRTITLTISAGAAALSEQFSNVRSLLQAADRALFEAKARGRNRVVAASSDASITDTGEVEAVVVPLKRTRDEESA